MFSLSNVSSNFKFPVEIIQEVSVSYMKWFLWSLDMEVKTYGTNSSHILKMSVGEGLLEKGNKQDGASAVNFSCYQGFF